MVKTQPNICNPKDTDKDDTHQHNQTQEFEYEEQLNSRIHNRKRRNALTPSMVQDIQEFIKKGNFS